MKIWVSSPGKIPWESMVLAECQGHVSWEGGERGDKKEQCLQTVVQFTCIFLCCSVCICIYKLPYVSLLPSPTVS